MPPHPPAQHSGASDFCPKGSHCKPGPQGFAVLKIPQDGQGEGGHSLLQDTELFTLLEAQVSVVRRLIAVQGDNQVVCKDRGSQGEDFWSRLGGGVQELEVGEERRGRRLTAKDPQALSSRPCWLRSPCSGEAGGLDPS